MREREREGEVREWEWLLVGVVLFWLESGGGMQREGEESIVLLLVVLFWLELGGSMQRVSSRCGGESAVGS